MVRKLTPDSSVILPFKKHSAGARLDLNTFTARLEGLAAILDDLLEGKKPAIDPKSPLGKVMLKQTTAMFRAGTITPTPQMLFTFPDEDANQTYQIDRLVMTTHQAKGDTYYHTLMQPLIDQQIEISTHISPFGVTVAGADPLYRSTQIPSDQILQETQAMIIPPVGDLFSLRQLLTALKQKRHNNFENYQVLMINNVQEQGTIQDSFWKPVIDYLGLQDFSYIDIVNDLFDVKKKYRFSFDGNYPVSLPHLPHMKVRPSSLILLHTTSALKVSETRRTMNKGKYDVILTQGEAFFPGVPEALEDGLDAAANVMRKLWGIALFLRSPEHRAHTLKKLGIPASDVMILADDRYYFYYDEERPTNHSITNFRNDPAFQDVAFTLPPFAPSPGTELKGYRTILPVSDEMQILETVAVRDNRVFRAVDGAVLGMVSLQALLDATSMQELREKTLLSGAQTDNGIRYTPAEKLGHRQENSTDRHFIPLGYDVTVSEISGYKTSLSSAALALTGLMHMAKVPQRSGINYSLTDQFRGQPSELTIATQYSADSIFATHGSHKKRIRSALNKGLSETIGIPHEPRFISGAHGGYDNRTGDHLASYWSRQKMRVKTEKNWLEKYDRLLHEPDAFLIMPDRSIDRAFPFSRSRRNYLLATAIVDKQTRQSIGFPQAIIGYHSDPSFSGIRAAMEDFTSGSLSGDTMESYFSLPESSQDLVRDFSFDLSIPRHKASPQVERVSASGKAFHHGMIKASIFCSASNLGVDNCRELAEISYRLAQSGIALKTGGGKKGLMWVSNLFYQLGQHDFDPKHSHTHLRTIQCTPTKAIEGEYVGTHKNVLQELSAMLKSSGGVFTPEIFITAGRLFEQYDKQRFYRSPDFVYTDSKRTWSHISWRMVKLVLGADVFICAPGAWGTLQEIEAVQQAKFLGIIPNNIPMRLLNMPVNVGGQKRGAFDYFTEDYDANFPGHLNGHNIRSMSSAQEILSDVLPTLGLDLPNPFWSSKPEFKRK